MLRQGAQALPPPPVLRSFSEGGSALSDFRECFSFEKIVSKGAVLSSIFSFTFLIFFGFRPKATKGYAPLDPHRVDPL